MESEAYRARRDLAVAAACLAGIEFRHVAELFSMPPRAVRQIYERHQASPDHLKSLNAAALRSEMADARTNLSARLQRPIAQPPADKRVTRAEKSEANRAAWRDASPQRLADMRARKLSESDAVTAKTPETIANP